MTNRNNAEDVIEELTQALKDAIGLAEEAIASKSYHGVGGFKAFTREKEELTRLKTIVQQAEGEGPTDDTPCSDCGAVHPEEEDCINYEEDDL